MNVIDLIHRNFFLKKIFPDGLSEFVYIGPFGLSEAGGFSMSIHTRQKPAMEIAKWGAHGRDYDVIMINLLGSWATNINIENWVNSEFAVFDFSQSGENIHVSAREASWAFDVTVGTLIFQSCITYVE